MDETIVGHKRREPARRLSWRVSGVVGTLCLVLTQGTPAPAWSEPAPAFSMQVSPTRLVIPAGTVSTTQRFEVTNKGSEPFHVTVEKADFITDVSGALKFQPAAPYAAAAWASVTPTSFTVAAGRKKAVKIEIEVPRAPEPGDHQLALVFKVPAGRNAANIRINRGIAAPIFITVPGAVDPSVELTELRAPEFVMGGPVPITARLHSRGTVHRDFRGLKRLHVQAGDADLTFPDFTVVRGSLREVTTNWDPPLACLCEVKVSVPGPGKGTRSATVTVLVLPLDLIAVLLAVVLALWLIGWWSRRRHQARYEARVRAAAVALTEDGSRV